VAEITHVINFDMPDSVDAYTHRIGRTGRAHQTGEAYTFAGHEDESMVRKIEKVLGARIERRQLPGFNYDNTKPANQSRPNLRQQSQSHSRNGRTNNNNGRDSSKTTNSPSRRRRRRRQ
jgi:ATP-dependent RNA helicase RhlE